MVSKCVLVPSLFLCVVACAQPSPPVPCKLRTFPPPAAEPGNIILREDFETASATVTGEHRYAPGRTGQGLYLDMPDGRYELPLGQPRTMPTGTIEWWAKPRPAAQVWSDQGWHYFLHCAPPQPGGVRFDLSRSPATQLQISASCGDQKQSVWIKPGGADVQQWHHLLVSWDFSGERQSLWLLLDGAGGSVTFPRAFAPPVWSSLQFGNTPAGEDIPFLPMDGGIDDLRVSSDPVTARLTP